MTVTKDQAQMLATLAVACRPHRAPTWDEAGVIANIVKVKERDLSLVVLAVIRAASDRECASPGVIPSNGTHWQEQLKPPKWEPTILNPAERCGICAKSQQACASAPRFADDDHTFIADFKDKRDGDSVRQIVDAVKAEVAVTVEPTERKGLDALLPEERNSHVAELRAQTNPAAREQIKPAETEPDPRSAA